MCRTSNTVQPPRICPEPTIGLHVRRRDDGRVGFIQYIAKEGDRRARPHHVFMVVGDVDVFLADTYCTSIVTHSSRFWQSWDLVRCDHCKTDQCEYYTKLVDLGMSFALAARVAIACHTGETLTISPDDHIELCEFQSKTQTDAELMNPRKAQLPMVSVVVDWSRHDAESI